MKKEIRIIDFDKKYAKEIYDMQALQWGVWDDEKCIEVVKDNEIILIALCDDNFAGVIIGQLEEDIFHLMICCIKPEYQKMGIGSMLLSEIMKRASQDFHFSKFRAEAVSVYGKCNSRKLLENFQFNLLRIDKRYWGKLYPHVLCEECHKKPCECDSLVFEKENTAKHN